MDVRTCSSPESPIEITIPLDLIERRLLPALIGAGVTYRRVQHLSGFEYLTEDVIADYEHDLEQLLDHMERAGWTPKKEDSDVNTI